MRTSETRGPAVLRLLPDPDRGYDSLREELVRLDWQWANESQQLPTIPGEPEWVAYRHPSGATLEYEFLPPVRLRTLTARGAADALAPLATLPRLHPAGVRALLDAADIEMVLRGLLGVRALVWVPLLGRVRELASGHPDGLVRRTAADIAVTVPGLVAADVGRFKALRAAQPGRSVLLTLLPAADRRQVLRWLGVAGRPGPGTAEALHTGLADDDAEVRATAAVVAARLGLGEFADQVSALPVPAVLAGPVRLATEALQAGRPLLVPEIDPAWIDPAETDADELLLLALADPVVDVPAPDRLPPHLTAESGLRLRASGLPVALVPAVPHWLRSGGESRRVTVEPFLITAVPLDAGTARLLGLAADGTGATPDADPFLADAPTAADLADRLSSLEGVPLQLVSAQRWEAALRGPDGRRYTAGNVEHDVAVSPWGALAVPGVTERLADGLAADPADLGSTRTADPAERLPVRLAMRFPL